VISLTPSSRAGSPPYLAQNWRHDASVMSVSDGIPQLLARCPTRLPTLVRTLFDALCGNEIPAGTSEPVGDLVYVLGWSRVACPDVKPISGES